MKEFKDSMPALRYEELQNSPDMQLSPEELEQGYRFCCEWDGLLIHHTHHEAFVCSCLIEAGYKVPTGEREDEKL